MHLRVPEVISTGLSTPNFVLFDHFRCRFAGRLGLWEPLPALHLFAALVSKKASLITSSALKSLIKDDM